MVRNGSAGGRNAESEDQEVKKQGRREQEDGDGKKLRLAAAPSAWDLRFLLSQYRLFSPPSRALAAETLSLERAPNDLVNQAYALTPAEIELTWQTAPQAHTDPGFTTGSGH